MSLYYVETFYFFKEIQQGDILSIRAWLMGKAEQHKILGLIVLGTEGLNTTLAVREEGDIEKFKSEVFNFFGVKDIFIKRSQSNKAPFRRFVVKVRDEIVTLGRPEYVPGPSKNHLSPDEWDEMLKREDSVVVDTRNDYEYEIGTFEKAHNLNIKEFTEFPDKMKEFISDKEAPHLIFCTGGIRCEKAIYELEKQGYKNVYQLAGGILNYLEQKPEGTWQGECFVFDSRVAVGKDLKPSQKYSLCPQCGEVGSEVVQCRKCDESTKLCKKCVKITKDKPEYETCSKNCRYHYQRDPKSKGPQQKQFYHS